MLVKLLWKVTFAYLLRYLWRKHFEIVSDELLCLASVLTANESFQVRKSAIALLKYFEKKSLGSESLERYTEAICSKSSVVYKKFYLIFRMISKI